MDSRTRLRVLFVCIGNACRSPMAESIARREADDVIEPTSAGLYPLGHLPENTVSTLVKNCYSAEGLSSKCITREAVKSADLIVNLSGTSINHLFSTGPSRLRDDQRVENWDVADPYGEEPCTYQKILEDIEFRVIRLANRLRSCRSAHA
jgi:protein-tyrosine-phosphatase